VKRRLIALGFALSLLLLIGRISTASFATSSHPTHQFTHVCSAAPAGYANCHAILVGSPDIGNAGSPSGYNPPDLQSAYKLPSAGTGQTVAIVDAYNDPNAESDLGVYRSQFGLSACTTANGCFRKVNQTGGTKYPRGNTGWAEEISLDLDMVSAICPNCHILLVEAKTNSFANL